MLLIIEDDADARHSLAALLTEEGYAVETAENGRAALDLLLDRGQRPCLILLDLHMPVIDGYELLDRLALEPELAGIPVCVVSATPPRRFPSRTLPSGYILRKPIPLDELLAIIGKHCLHRNAPGVVRLGRIGKI